MTPIGWDILGVIAVGAGAAALLFAGLHAARRAGFSGPRWLLPAGIGLAMLIYAVWNEYSWAGRVAAQLPPGLVVVDRGHGGRAWRPWALVVPLTTRLTVVDTREAPAGSGRRAKVLLIERWQPTQSLTLEVDCETARQRMLKANGTPTGWTDPAPEHPALRVLCAPT